MMFKLNDEFKLNDATQAQTVKYLPAMQETSVQFLGWENPLEEEMATHPRILAWRIPWTVTHQALLSMGFSGKEHWKAMANNSATYTCSSFPGG